jgi:cold shock protein
VVLNVTALKVENMLFGVIKTFNFARGFGFIRRDDRGEDAFVHATEVARSGIAELVVGDRVSFELVEDPKSGRLRAGRIQLLGHAAPR